MTHLKQGDLVLAQCMIGSQKEFTENQGTFLYEGNGDMLVCRFVGDQTRQVHYSKVKKYEPIDHEQMQRECIAEFPAVAQMVKFACENLLDPKDFYGVEVNEADVTLSILNGVVTVEPAACRANTIVGIREFAGWEVSVWRGIPATRMDPPDVDQCSAGIVRGDLKVAHLVVQTLFNIKVNAYFENVSESRLTAGDE